jgi:short-subunit dehydrogenase
MKVTLKKIKDQVMVITGASSGIGLTTARMAAERGARLVLAGCSEGALEQLNEELTAKGIDAITVTADVGHIDEVRKICRAAEERFGAFDTWVNNAGIGMYGKVEEGDIEDMRKLFETNFWGVVYGSLEAVKHLKGKGGDYGGALINIGSTESDRAVPLQAIYAASKHAVKGFTDALRMELEESGAPVSVTLIKPGPIDTPFTSNAKNYLDSEPQHLPPVYAPETVAQAILHAAETPIRDLFVGGGGKANSALGYYAPRLADKIGEKIFISGTRSEKPARDKDALDEPSEDLRARGDYSGHVARTSWYTQSTMHSVLTGFAVVGAAFTLKALWSGGRRTATTHYDGNHFTTAVEGSFRVDKAKIHEHMKVRGSDGHPVGSVDRLEGEWIKLTKDNPEAPGEHHYIDLKEVRSVEGDVVCLDRTAEEAKRRWSGEPVA